MKSEKLDLVRGSGNAFRDLGIENADGGRRWFGVQCPGLGPGASPMGPMASCTSSGSRRKISWIAS